MLRVWHFLFLAAAIGAILLPGISGAQAPVTLQEQLSAQYKTVKIGPDGEIAGDPGTLLAVQKSGIIGVPWQAVALCPAKFQDNVLHISTGFCAGMMQNVSGYFPKGAKVYPLKMDVNVGRGKISFQVVGCKICNHSNLPFPRKAEVVFEFSKGYLEKASASEVEDIIGQVFTITTNDDQQAAGGDAQPATDQQASPQPAQEQQQEPATVQVGMTTDQVQSALGKPDKIFTVGTKQIYVYKDVKVTFLNGQVSDVQ
ncbi:MAG TPA: hypothetical protein VKF84_01005 [Candidatus Sulfotelmatobacter sp.]|nr:hypothetical protein [Candidatus Sulfotelmatobacter sp.]